MTHYCPRKEFYDLLQKSTDSDEVMGSSLSIYPGDSVFNHIKNTILTDWLRLKIYFHDTQKCENCLQKP